MPPADISITANSWVHGQGGGVKKTSSVVVNRPIGADVKLGLLLRDRPLPAQQVIALEFLDAATGKRVGQANEIPNPAATADWQGAIAALNRFIDPGPDRHWALFALPSLDIAFTSELTVVPPPRPPEQDHVPVVAIHVDPGDAEATIRARMRQGAYGFGVTIIRAADADWGREDRGARA